MWEKIGQTPLRTGEAIEVRRVTVPDRYHELGIRELLPRYSALWTWHLGLAFRGKLDDLRTLFYVGVLKDQIVGNVSTFQYGPVEIVAHLFTARRHREKGICTNLMSAMVQDFRNRGGKVLIGGFRPASYPIAKSLGFKSLIDSPEVMHLELDRRFEQYYFRPEKVSCRDSKWHDWPGVSLLFGVKEGWRPRSVKYKIFGSYDYEDHFLQDMSERQEGICKSKVLVTERRSVIGYAVLTFKRHYKGNFWLLDFFIHPTSFSYAEAFLNALAYPSGKIRCYVEQNCPEKLELLGNKGFRVKNRRQFRFVGRTLETIMMER
jgi:hypothetical protein